MLPPQAGGFDIPAQGAADSADAIGHDSLSVARAAQNNAPVELATAHSLRDWTDKERIIHWRFRVCAEIGYVLAELFEKRPDFFFVLESRVVRADRNFHLLSFDAIACQTSQQHASLFTQKTADETAPHCGRHELVRMTDICERRLAHSQGKAARPSFDSCALAFVRAFRLPYVSPATECLFFAR